MRIKESQLRLIVRQEIKALMEAEEEQPEMQDASEKQPESEPEEQPEEGPSKATQFAEKISERLKREPELSSPEAMIDIMTEFLESLGFGNEAKLSILKTVKTNTVR